MENEIVIKAINDMIKTYKNDGKISTKEISDVYHTFKQLYQHRMILFALVCNAYSELAWKSRKHYNEENDPMFNGDFIAGIDTPLGVATYHIKLEYWDLFKVIELDRGLPYDGHNADEDFIRLKSLLENPEFKLKKTRKKQGEIK